MPFLFILLLLIPTVAFTHPGSSTDIGDSTFYNFDKFSGSRQSVSQTDFYNFSNGSSSTRNRVGSIDFYSGSRPNLSGSTNRVGGTTFGNWRDGHHKHTPIDGWHDVSRFQRWTPLHEQSDRFEYTH